MAEQIVLETLGQNLWRLTQFNKTFDVIVETTAVLRDGRLELEGIQYRIARVKAALLPHLVGLDLYQQHTEALQTAFGVPADRPPNPILVGRPVDADPGIERLFEPVMGALLVAFLRTAAANGEAIRLFDFRPNLGLNNPFDVMDMIETKLSMFDDVTYTRKLPNTLVIQNRFSDQPLQLAHMSDRKWDTRLRGQCPRVCVVLGSAHTPEDMMQNYFKPLATVNSSLRAILFL